MAATMTRKKSTEDDATTTTRMFRETAEKIGWIVKVRKLRGEAISIHQYIEGIVSPTVEADYAAVAGVVKKIKTAEDAAQNG